MEGDAGDSDSVVSTEGSVFTKSNEGPAAASVKDAVPRKTKLEREKEALESRAVPGVDVSTSSSGNTPLILLIDFVAVIVCIHHPADTPTKIVA